MTTVGRQNLARRALGALFACMLLLTLAPVASAQDEPAFVFPCARRRGMGGGARPAHHVLLRVGHAGRSGLAADLVMAHQATLIVEDDEGHTVLSIGPDEFATLWGDPESVPVRLRRRHVCRPDRLGSWLVLPARSRSAGGHLHDHPRGVAAPPGDRRVPYLLVRRRDTRRSRRRTTLQRLVGSGQHPRRRGLTPNQGWTSPSRIGILLASHSRRKRSAMPGSTRGGSTCTSSARSPLSLRTERRRWPRSASGRRAIQPRSARCSTCRAWPSGSCTSVCCCS